MSANSPLVIIPTLSAVAIKFRQSGLIADLVLPRVGVDKQEFIDLSDRMAEWITPPETNVGRVGMPNQLSNSVQDPVYLATINQGLDEPVPNQDSKNAPAESALMRATQRVMGFVELRREIRAAAIANNAANFAYTATLSGTSMWSDYANSNPLADLLSYLDQPFMRPNKLVMGRAVWTVLSQHPKLTAVAGATAGARRITRQELANLLEIDEIIVGDGWINTAPKGKTPVKTRIWGKFCAGIYSGSVSQADNGMWGYTAQFGTRIAGTIVDPNIGMYGGVKVRAGESVREVVTAKEFGFLLTNVVE
jgi:hypothetical protein